MTRNFSKNRLASFFSLLKKKWKLVWKSHPFWCLYIFNWKENSNSIKTNLSRFNNAYSMCLFQISTCCCWIDWSLAIVSLLILPLFFCFVLISPRSSHHYPTPLHLILELICRRRRLDGWMDGWMSSINWNTISLNSFYFNKKKWS